MKEPKERKKIEEEIGLEGERRLEERVEEERKRIEERRLEKEERLEEIRRLEELEEKEKERIRTKLKEERIPKEEELEEKEKKKSILEAIKEFTGVSEEELQEYAGLILDNSERAWRARRDEVKEGNKGIIATAAGIESEEARKFLEEVLCDKSGKIAKGKKQKNWKVGCIALMRNRTEWAKEMRDGIWWDEDARIGWGEEVGKRGRVRGGINMKIGEYVGKLLAGLHKTEWGFNLRKLIDKVYPKGFYIPPDLLYSTNGLSVEEKEKIKWWEKVTKSSPADAILSFLGDSSPKAQQKVAEYYAGDEKLEWARQRYLESIYEKSL